MSRVRIPLPAPVIPQKIGKPKKRVFKFPEDVEKTIEKIIGGWRRDYLHKLATASWKLAEIFQKGENFPITNETVMPYLFYFFPKTFSANFSVLNSIYDRIKEGMKKKGEYVFVELSAGTCSGTTAFLKILKKMDGENGEEKKLKKKIRVTIQDISFPALEIGKRVIDEFMSPLTSFDVEVREEIGDASRVKIQKITGGRKPDLVLISFSLYDVFRDDVEDMIIWCDKILRALNKGGLLVIVEPALKRKNSLFIMKIRDALRGNVLAPCPHMKDCPILRRKDDWCHFGVKWRPPDFLTRGMYLIRGRPPDLNFSYLVLSPNSASEKIREHDYTIARVVSHRLDEKGRVRFWTCENRGKVLYQFLRRSKTEGNSEVEYVHSGDLVSIQGSEEKNGYFEITERTFFKIRSKLFED